MANDPEETAAAAEEDTGGQIAPIVKLEEVTVITGEEDEDAILDLKSKLYRFDKEGNKWNERGVGSVKLLRHKETGKVRLVMRQSETLMIRANHLVSPTTSIREHALCDKSCVWHAFDFSDGELKGELFCIKFGSIEDCKKFMETFQEVAESQQKEESKDASAAAGLLEKPHVDDRKEEVVKVVLEKVKEATPENVKEEEPEKAAADSAKKME